MTVSLKWLSAFLFLAMASYEKIKVKIADSTDWIA